MKTIHRIVRLTAILAVFACALAVKARAQNCNPGPDPTQFCLYSQTSWTTMPVWLRVDAPETCQGSAVTALGYSIDSSPFMNWGQQADAGYYYIDTIDFRIASQSSGATYTVHYKAWSGAGECDYDVPVTVDTGQDTYEVYNVQSGSNVDWVDQLDQDCATYDSTHTLLNWFWAWDQATGHCTLAGPNYSGTTSNVDPSYPSMDGLSRLFYTDWQWNSQLSGQNPGERYSVKFADAQYGPGDTIAATHFVYDTYIYIATTGLQSLNMQAVEMDTNQAWDAHGDVLIFGLQCVHGVGWQYTANVGGVDKWETPNPILPCDPQYDPNNPTSGAWAPNEWHHVQLAVHRDDTGAAYYDYIVVDGTYTQLNWSWNSSFSFSNPWNPGDLVLNFQVDGIDNNGNEATATVYMDGTEMIYW